MTELEYFCDAQQSCVAQSFEILTRTTLPQQPQVAAHECWSRVTIPITAYVPVSTTAVVKIRISQFY
jgi:hypothetical protein